jgi:hypothetical protein
MSPTAPGDPPGDYLECAHAERTDGVCTACGHCLHEVILNGACYMCGSTDIDGALVSPKPEAQLIPPTHLLRKR